MPTGPAGDLLADFSDDELSSWSYDDLHNAYVAEVAELLVYALAHPRGLWPEGRLSRIAESWKTQLYDRRCPFFGDDGTPTNMPTVTVWGPNFLKYYGYKVPAPAEASGPPTIWYHGGRSYSADGKAPVAVSREAHNLMQQFLGKGEALRTAALEKAGVSNVARVVSQIIRRFGKTTVRRPGRNKGSGYFVRVLQL
jgi:hypothetical protein